MRANYKKCPLSKAEVRGLVTEEVDKLYSKIENDIMAQMLSVVLFSLETDYGWKRDRLRRFMDNLHSTAELASGTDVFGNKIDTEIIIQHLIDKYGIDCREEVKGM